MTGHGVAAREVGFAADAVPEEFVVDRFDVADQDCGASEAEVACGTFVGGG